MLKTNITILQTDLKEIIIILHKLGALTDLLFFFFFLRVYRFIVSCSFHTLKSQLFYQYKFNDI
jgi:hypothetical protein